MDSLCPANETEEDEKTRTALGKKYNNLRDKLIARLFPSTAEKLHLSNTKYLNDLLLKNKREIREEAQGILSRAITDNCMDQTDNESQQSSSSTLEAGRSSSIDLFNIQEGKQISSISSSEDYLDRTLDSVEDRSTNNESHQDTDLDRTLDSVEDRSTNNESNMSLNRKRKGLCPNKIFKRTKVL